MLQLIDEVPADVILNGITGSRGLAPMLKNEFRPPGETGTAWSLAQSFHRIFNVAALIIIKTETVPNCSVTLLQCSATNGEPAPFPSTRRHMDMI